jgi:hypothetical protein
MVKIPGVTLNLAGTDWQIPPLRLGDLERMSKDLAAFDGSTVTGASVAVVIDATFAALKRNYPDLTRDQVADMLDVANMLEVMQAVMDISGMKRKEIEAGNALGKTVSPAST